MKSLILYASKTGTTKRCAEIIKQNNPQAKIFDVVKFNQDINDYESIVLMSPIYMGKINKHVLNLIMKYQSQLLAKQLKIIVCSMNKEQFDQTISSNFDETMRQHADIISVGGAYHFDKLNFLYRFIVKKIAGVSQSVDEVNYELLNTITI